MGISQYIGFVLIAIAAVLLGIRTEPFFVLCISLLMLSGGIFIGYDAGWKDEKENK